MKKKVAKEKIRLYRRIERVRNMLNKIGKDHPKSYELSRRLDDLIASYMRNNNNESRSGKGEDDEH